jgi:hypothetical protein
MRLLDEEKLKSKGNLQLPKNTSPRSKEKRQQQQQQHQHESGSDFSGNDEHEDKNEDKNDENDDNDESEDENEDEKEEGKEYAYMDEDDDYKNRLHPTPSNAPAPVIAPSAGSISSISSKNPSSIPPSELRKRKRQDDFELPTLPNQTK